jgi:tetratricopeptide (TPR) repeat protein
MIYVIVMMTSAGGIVGIVLMRGILRSRNARRIAQSVRRGFMSVEKRNARLLPDTPIEKKKKSPRACAVELQQVRTLLREAEKAITKKDIKEAERSLIQALTIHPHAKDVRVRLAHVYLESHREKKAEALYRELLQEMKDASLYGNLGLACYKQENYVGACKAYQQALNMDPKNPERSYDLGRACIAAKHFEEAAPLLQKAAKSLSRDIALLHLLAQSYLQISGGNISPH